MNFTFNPINISAPFTNEVGEYYNFTVYFLPSFHVGETADT